MPNKLKKSLHHYLSKIKTPRCTPPLQVSSPSNFSSSKSWIFSACKHPKTPSFSIQRNDTTTRHNNDNAATLVDVDRFLFENFRSLYLINDEEDRNRKSADQDFDEGENISGRILLDSPRLIDLPPNLCKSHRFYVARPSSSSSLIDESRTSVATTFENSSSSSKSTANLIIESATSSTSAAFKDSVAILKYSLSPYDDFRKSMREMAEARLENYEDVDWEFMEELLFSYLNLNDKKSHKFIISAFIDLAVVFLSETGRSSGGITEC